MEHLAIHKTSNGTHKIFLRKSGKYFTIEMDTFDREGYYNASLSCTILETSDGNKAMDFFEDTISRNNMKRVY